jgi:hypothetical protein
MKKALSIIAIWFCCSPLMAQTNYSPETLEKIKEVEQTVSGSLLLNDDQPGT